MKLNELRQKPELFAEMEQTSELCMEALKVNSKVIEYIKDPSYEMYAKAIDYNLTAIKFLPKEFLTIDLIKRIVSKVGCAIQYIDNPTDEMYAAVEPISGLPYLPDEFKTEEKCIAYLAGTGCVDHNRKFYVVNVDIKHIPKHFHNHDFFLKVAKAGHLEHIPAKYRSDEILYAAVTAYSWNLKYIDEQPEDLCWLAIKSDPQNIIFVKNQTEEMKWYVIRSHPLLDIEEIQNPTQEMIIESIKADGDNIRYVENPDIELVKLAFETSPDVLRYVTQTEEICWYALRNFPNSITLIKEPTIEMYLYAFTHTNSISSLFKMFKPSSLRKLYDKDPQGYLDLHRLVFKSKPELYKRVHETAPSELTEMVISMHPYVKEWIEQSTY